MGDAFRYIFRFCCDPGFNDEAEIRALEQYVRQARIDDVAVFANVEEINTGHMTLQEQEVYLRLMGAASAICWTGWASRCRSTTGIPSCMPTWASG